MSFTLNFQRIFVVLLAFFTLGQSHMIMRTPKPFGSPDSSPLDPSGSNFPCKGGSGYDFSNPTVMPIGSSQTLSFTGSAVHGGGSCQVALTTDLAPTASTKWMVIKSIEGGCPASIAGNFPADPEGTSASTFQVQIPDLPTGKYVWAWSWLNKVGNREFYMNCAPVEITAGQQKRYAPLGAVLAPRADSYPDLFVANIASKNKCVTKEGFDYLYPAPGPNVQKIGEGPFDPLVCDEDFSNGAPVGQPTSGDSPSAAPSGSSSTPSGSPTTPSDSPQGSGSNGNPGQNTPGTQTGVPGSFASGSAPLPSGVNSVPGGSSSPATGSTPPTNSSPPIDSAPPAGGSSPSNPAPAPAASSSTSGTPATPPTSGSSGAVAGSQAPGSACSNEGVWSCSSDGSSFQRCASGQWSQTMKMAGGMSCTPGESATLSMSRVAAGGVRK